MTDERDAVVITASRYPHGYASVRSLAAQGVHTIAAVDDESLEVTTSRFCDESVLVPPPREISAYKDALLGLAARPDVRTIVPHRPHDAYILSKFADEFDRYIDVVVPDLERLRDVHDRKRLAEAAERAGVAIPETQLLGEVDDWGGDRIIKSRYNLLTDEYLESFDFADSKIAKSVEHVPPGETPDPDAIVEKMSHEPIVQEYVEGKDEYVFGALYDEGEALATFQHRQLRGDSYTGSGGVFRETVDIPELEEAGRTILDELEWHGLACIEYIEDADGEFSIVEINPRMWQSLGCATHAGADFPHWYWLAAMDRADEIDPGYEVGTGTHYLYGELEHLVSVAREESPFVERPSLPGRTKEILESCRAVPNFDYLHLDDPRPIVRQVRNEVEGAVTRRL